MRWIPLLASVGLVSLMVMPAPGPWGLVIGVGCSLTIILFACLWYLDRSANYLALRWAQRTTRPGRRSLHAGSGMIRKTTKPQPETAPAGPPQPSPVQKRVAGRREAVRPGSLRLR